jgi:hypothetical protein
LILGLGGILLGSQLIVPQVLHGALQLRAKGLDDVFPLVLHFFLVVEHSAPRAIDGTGKVYERCKGPEITKETHLTKTERQNYLLVASVAAQPSTSLWLSSWSPLLSQRSTI